MGWVVGANALACVLFESIGRDHCFPWLGVYGRRLCGHWVIISAKTHALASVHVARAQLEAYALSRCRYNSLALFGLRCLRSLATNRVTELCGNR